MDDFKHVIKDELNLKENELQLVGDLYKIFLKLEEEDKNHVWTSIIKNAFAPLTITSSIGKFDYVVGNPPWINWESLPEYYRENTKDLWDHYGLLIRTKGMGMGKIKKDMAMLFVTRCFDRYVKDDGTLSFLIPFTAFKTQAGAGCMHAKVHDLVELFPFESAINRTSLIVIKGGKTEFPIPCVMWHNPRSKGIDTEATLEEVRKTTKQFDLVFIPIERDKPVTPWMETSEEAFEGIKKVIGKGSSYRAYAGVFTALNQVYWIRIIEKTPSGLLITNPVLPGQKKR